MIYFVIDFTQFLGEWLTCECVLFDYLNRLTDLYGYLVSVLFNTISIWKRLKQFPPLCIMMVTYVHKKVRGKTSSLVAWYHYMCLYTRNSWEMEAIFNTVLFQETEHWNSNLPTWLGYFGYIIAGYLWFLHLVLPCLWFI